MVKPRSRDTNLADTVIAYAVFDSLSNRAKTTCQQQPVAKHTECVAQVPALTALIVYKEVRRQLRNDEVRCSGPIRKVKVIRL